MTLLFSLLFMYQAKKRFTVCLLFLWTLSTCIMTVLDLSFIYPSNNCHHVFPLPFFWVHSLFLCRSDILKLWPFQLLFLLGFWSMSFSKVFKVNTILKQKLYTALREKVPLHILHRLWSCFYIVVLWVFLPCINPTLLNCTYFIIPCNPHTLLCWTVT